MQRIQQLAEQMGLDLRKCIGLLRRSVRGCSKPLACREVHNPMCFTSVLSANNT